MKRHREIVVASPTLGAQEIARQIERFADHSPEWAFPSQESSEYERLCGEPSCCIISPSGEQPRSAVHMTKKRKNAIYATNIVPLDQNELSLSQYNAIAFSAARFIRIQAKKTNTPIVVSLSKAEVTLADVVPGTIPKKLFERYLVMYPLSHHPLDNGRLYEFICALSRYNRKPFDVEAFEQLLMEELGWSKSDAAWCRTRIEIGLETLAANRIFHG